MSRPRTQSVNFRRRTAYVLAGLLCAALVLSGTGFGAEPTGSNGASASVLSTISMSDPVALAGANPVCSDAVSPLDTDDCTDVAYAGGGERTLRLGQLAGADVQAGSLTWRVTTTNPAGYVVHMSNAGAAPLLRSSTGNIPDMSASQIPATGVPAATHFGVAMGDAAGDGEGAVSFGGSPWVTAAGQQGELFRGIPTSGMVVAQRTAPKAADPFTATFAAASVVASQPTPGSYTGTIRMVASTL